jgi:hypothetical protein
MSEQEKAAELARLRDDLAGLEGGEAADSRGPDARTYNERQIARLRARVAELEAELGI